jgi:hypothetical protein
MTAMNEDVSEVLWGAEAIAKEIGANLRQCYHLLETRKIPARKVGKTWTATRSRLHKFFQETESETSRVAESTGAAPVA